MGLTDTLHHFRRLAPSRQVTLCRAALGERHPGVQAAAVQLLLDAHGADRADVVLSCWDDVLPEVRRALRRGARDALLRDARTWLDRGDAQERTLACRVLVDVGGPGACDSLVRALDDAENDVRSIAHTALLRHFEALTESVEAKRDGRSHTLRTDGWEPGLFDAYGTALQNFRPGTTEPFAAFLTRMGPAALPTLTKALDGDAGPLTDHVRELLTTTASAHATRLALGLAGHASEAARTLGRAVLDHGDDEGAARRLAAVVAASAAEPRIGRAPWPSRLARHATRIDGELALRVVHALDQVEDEAARDHCLVAFLRHADGKVQLAAARRVVAWKIDGSAKLLAPLVGSDDPDLRRLAMREVARVGFEIYLRRFDGLTPETREAAARAVAKIDEGVFGRLTEEIRSLDPAARIKALQIVGYLDAGEDLRATLLGLLSDPDRRVRATALRIVELTGSVPGMKALIDALSDPDRRIRANAIETFESLGNDSHFEIFVPFLSDRDNRVRANAAKALWNLGYPPARDTLATMLDDDDDPGMRLSAVWALRELACDGARALLETRAAREPEDSIRSKMEDAARELLALEEAR